MKDIVGGNEGWKYMNLEMIFFDDSSFAVNEIFKATSTIQLKFLKRVDVSYDSWRKSVKVENGKKRKFCSKFVKIS